jgi:ribosomal-protein-alanine N-acetyltransferase
MKYIPRPLLKSTEDALDHIAMIDAKIKEIEHKLGNYTQNDSKLIGIIGFRIKNIFVLKLVICYCCL